jgi:hypothetical protein
MRQRMFSLGPRIERGCAKYDLAYGFGRRGDGRLSPDYIGRYDRTCPQHLLRQSVTVLLWLRWQVLLQSTRLSSYHDARGGQGSPIS